MIHCYIPTHLSFYLSCLSCRTFLSIYLTCLYDASIFLPTSPPSVLDWADYATRKGTRSQSRSQGQVQIVWQAHHFRKLKCRFGGRHFARSGADLVAGRCIDRSIDRCRERRTRCCGGLRGDQLELRGAFLCSQICVLCAFSCASCALSCAFLEYPSENLPNLAGIAGSGWGLAASWQQHLNWPADSCLSRCRCAGVGKEQRPEPVFQLLSPGPQTEKA